VRISNR